MIAAFSIDTKTLVIVASLTAVSVGTSFGFAWMAARRERCLAVWSVAFLLVAAGYLLVWTRNISPDFISIVVANTLLIAGGLALVRGIDSFLEIQNTSWQLYLCGVAACFLLHYYTYFQPSLDARIIVVSIAVGLFAFVSAWRLLRNYEVELRNPQAFVATLFLLHGLIMVYRAAASTLGSAGSELFTTNIATIASLLDFVLLFPCVSLGLLSMVHARASVNLQCENRERRASEIKLLQTTQNLEAALAEIKTLKGIIPICMYCKKIRDTQGAWEQLEVYIAMRSDAEFSHGICPECLKQGVAES
ncbi:MAG: hypothetical protein IT367_05420 [Candidatus Hydrogenedentes bacterium]|nr:hypothetical protein [Candidatus Hydrogenedentota bacterium]